MRAVTAADETRTAYDVVASSYASRLSGDLDANPHDRAVLELFAALVLAGGGGRVGDLGCGPGRLTPYLAALGLDVFGLDLSPGMVEAARAAHPSLAFGVGDLRDLPLASGSLAGALAWYSLIHLPPDARPSAWAQLARVLRPGGVLLTATQVGQDLPRRREEAYGHAVSLTSYYPAVETVTAELVDAGFTIDTTLVRAPRRYETTPQAYLLARR